MTFILQNIRSGQPKEFSIKDLLSILGDPVNDEIRIGKQRFRISTCVELCGAEGEAKQWLKIPLTVNANGQTQFTIQLDTSNLDGIFMVVNNLVYDHNTSFTVSTTTLTWTGDFPLEQTDTVYIKQLRFLP